MNTARGPHIPESGAAGLSPEKEGRKVPSRKGPREGAGVFAPRSATVVVSPEVNPYSVAWGWAQPDQASPLGPLPRLFPVAALENDGFFSILTSGGLVVAASVRSFPGQLYSSYTLMSGLTSSRQPSLNLSPRTPRSMCVLASTTYPLPHTVLTLIRYSGNIGCTSEF